MDKTAKQPSGRPKRKPVGQRNRLELHNTDPTRVYRLINSDPYRVNMFLDAGYRIEKLDDFMHRARVDQAANIDNIVHVGGGKTQILVSIEKEFYDEDQALKQRKVDELENSIKPNSSEGQYGNVEIARRK